MGWCSQLTKSLLVACPSAWDPHIGIGIKLIKQVVDTISINKAVGVVHPHGVGREVVGGPPFSATGEEGVVTCLQAKR